MKLLMIDTSARAAKLAIAEPGHLIAEVFADSAFKHGVNLMPLTHHLLSDSGMTIADMDAFVAERKFALRSEIGVTGDYFRREGEYQVELAVKEGKSTIIGLTLAVPDEDEAQRLCEKWSQANQEIYAFIMKKLM